MLQNEFDATLFRLTNGQIDGKKFLLTVSGGRDSMTMAHLFLNSAYKPEIAIAHVNFTLRGDDSFSDEALVRDWAQTNNVTFFSTIFDTKSYAKQKSLSTQMAARELRYDWFYSLMEEHSFDFLSIAHNQDDTVETLFLNLLRGTGVNGLSGIKSINGQIIRPLLSFTREKITEFTKIENILYRDDITNSESHYSRNRLRNIVFPEFKKINPSFLNTVYRNISYFSEAGDIINELMEQRKSQIFSQEGELGILNISKLKEEKHPKFWLNGILRDYGFNSSQLLQIEAALNGQSGKRFCSQNYEIIIDRDKIKVYPKENTCPIPFTIAEPGVYFFGNVSFKVDVYLKPKGFKPLAENGVLYLDASAVHFPLICRSWLPADKFKPFGMKKGMKKLSDFFIDLKMDRIDKDRQPIILSKKIVDGTEIEDIVCLPGLRIDDKYKIYPYTKIILEITID